ncbi:unnamed protein product [Prorocentrum cordatum]|uniref:Uncharacterized protein n=1 Tax=Prorocentrum cordatum TaxID=2364126 RepID=A0ABN9WHC9_9DINO|nr:unnamed protein product [Polarella glacialis]
MRSSAARTTPPRPRRSPARAFPVRARRAAGHAATPRHPAASNAGRGGPACTLARRRAPAPESRGLEDRRGPAAATGGATTKPPASQPQSTDHSQAAAAAHSAAARHDAMDAHGPASTAWAQGA